MNIVQIFSNLLRNKAEGNENVAPEGFCPNCWGKQEYGGHFYEAVEKEQIDLNNVNERKGWIQAYTTERLEGIKLHKTEKGVYECQICKVSYE
ncbi:MAG: hypothetical protein AB8G11_07435 [Saprospiraceae bacterium]